MAKFERGRSAAADKEHAMNRAIFEVIPVEGAWLVRIPGDSVAEVRPTKTDAINCVRSLARAYDDWRARVFTDSGTLEAELSPTDTPPLSRP